MYTRLLHLLHSYYVYSYSIQYTLYTHTIYLSKGSLSCSIWRSFIVSKRSSRERPYLSRSSITCIVQSVYVQYMCVYGVQCIVNVQQVRIIGPYERNKQYVYTLSMCCVRYLTTTYTYTIIAHLVDSSLRVFQPSQQQGSEVGCILHPYSTEPLTCIHIVVQSVQRLCIVSVYSKCMYTYGECIVRVQSVQYLYRECVYS